MKRRLRLLAALISMLMLCAGCVDILQDREVLVESSWYGRVVDVKGQGVPGVNVTLHVLGDRGELYTRNSTTSAVATTKGVYYFDHIEIRDGTIAGYTTCTVGGVYIKGDEHPLIDESKKETVNVTSNGKNITMTLYRNVVNEMLVYAPSGA